MLSAIIIYATLTLASLLCLPLIMQLFSAAFDRGIGISRSLLFFLGGYCVWLSACAGAGHASFGLLITALIIVGGMAWVRWHRETLGWLRKHWRILLVIELTGVLVYGGVLVYRGWTADITTIDKYMDVGFAASILLEPQSPPRNMWFGGLPLNYYYLGHWSLAMQAYVARLNPTDLVIFAPALLAAMCVQACVTIVGTLVSTNRLAWSLLGGYLLVFAGSLNFTIYGLSNWFYEWQQTPYSSSIPPTITDALSPQGNIFDLPVTALLAGEIHAHGLGVIPLLGLLALLAHHVVAPSTSRVRFVAWYTLCAILIGSSYATNSWQYPSALAIWLLVWAVVWWKQRPAASSLRNMLLVSTYRPWLVYGILPAILILPMGLLAILPFLLHFETFSGSIPADAGWYPLPPPLDSLLVWSPVGTTLWDFLRSLGLLVLLAGLAGLLLLSRIGWRWLIGALVLGLLTSWYRPLNLVLLPCIAIGLWLALADTHKSAASQVLAGMLLAFTALLVLSCDYVVLLDHALRRSNMIFKFYFQAWVFLAVAAPLLLSTAFQRFPAHSLRGRSLQIVLLLMLLSGSITPLLLGRQWVRFNGDQWWGLQAMTQVAAYNPDQAAAIIWLQQQPDTGGVLEATANSTAGVDHRLRPSNVSALTGRPTVIGWMSYAAQWHNYGTDQAVHRLFNNSVQLMSRFPQTQQINDIHTLMRLYDVHYVMYGHYERKQWGSAGQQVLAAHLPLVWDSGQVQIYGQPDDLPEALVWLHPVDWGPLEYTSDHRQQLFSWLTGTSGKLSITSTRQALVEVQLSVLNSRMPGQLSIWQGEQQLALWDISPNRPIQRVLRLPVEAGTTTLELRTSVPLGEDQGRTITLALAQPTLRVLPMVEPYPVRPKMLPLALDLLK